MASPACRHFAVTAAVTFVAGDLRVLAELPERDVYRLRLPLRRMPRDTCVPGVICATST